MIGDTMGQAPSLSARIVLSDNKYKTIHHRKELHLMFSLLGPFYQIYGKDTASVLENEERVANAKTNLITSSPTEKVADFSLFGFLKDNCLGF